jgi:hypothetical protein
MSIVIAKIFSKASPRYPLLAISFFPGKKGYSFWNERQKKAFYFDPNQYFKKAKALQSRLQCAFYI